MNTYAFLSSQLGMLTLPLLGMATLAAILCLECLIRWLHATYSQTLVLQGRALVQQHQTQPEATLEQLLQRWLQAQQEKLYSGPSILQLIATAAPITGLLGTIIGLITSFDAIAHSSSGVNPALVADGLGIAMKTTAAGLVIALPCMCVASIYLLWVDRHLSNVADELNVVLAHQSVNAIEANLQGIQVDEKKTENKPEPSAQLQEHVRLFT